MKELSVFIDESGDIGSGSEYYLLTLVFHNQAKDVTPSITQYLDIMGNAQLAPMTFHFTPVTRGHQPYDSMDFAIRKRRFAIFRIFAEQTDYRYTVFVYRKKDISNPDKLEEKMRRDVKSFIIGNLEFFQSYDLVKIYYDNGQRTVKRAIHTAINEAISKEAIIYRDVSPTSYYLFQVADYICGIELTALRYQNHKEGHTEERFFGEWANFKKNYLRKIRKKRLG